MTEYLIYALLCIAAFPVTLVVVYLYVKAARIGWLSADKSFFDSELETILKEKEANAN